MPKHGVIGFALSIALVAGCGSSADSAPSGGGAAGLGGGGVSATGGTGASGSGGVAGSAGAPSGGGAGGATGGAGGSAGAAGAAGGSAGTGGNACDDPGPEPNESIVLATPACLPSPCEIGDCNSDGSSGYGGPLAPIHGVVGPGDVDNWKYDGKDNFGLCVVDAAAKTADSGFRLCIFVNCKAGATVVSSCPNGVAEDGDGSPGCCVTAPGEAKISYDCSGSVTDDDSARIVVRTDQASQCVSYDLDFHF